MPAPEPALPVLRRLLRITAIAAIVLALLVALLAWLAQPPRATAFLLGRIGTSLGLEIRAGASDYRLRGTPQLVLHDVVAQRRGDAAPLLRAERIFVALPWSTLRAGGDDLTVQRIELDAPVLDVPALQRWQATRPPSETRIPTLRDGLRVVRGRIVNDDWTIEGIDVALPSLAPGKPVKAQLEGRYLDPPTTIPFELAVAMSKPANDAGIATVGSLSIEGTGWRLPARLQLSGPLHLGNDEVRMAPATFGIAARYVSATSELPFTLGAFGPLHFDEGVWALDPATLVLRGHGPPSKTLVPQAQARGAAALGRRLVLRLEGRIAAWPQAWPSLPPPLSASTAPLPFALDYAGRSDLSGIAGLRVEREASHFDARFRLPEVLAWLDAGATGSPLPPLQGRLHTPRVDIAGTQLEGVEIDFDDPAIAAPTTP